ncbi:MAG: zinc-binding dehydrogenase [Dehalococcoidia bacterium]
MKAARIHQSAGIDSYVYEDAPDLEPGPHQVLVRVRACALNHLEAWAAKMPPGANFDPPRLLGADVSGVVESVGVAVRGISAGSEVLLQSGVSCNQCRACLSGEDNNCPQFRVLGQGVPGGLAEFVAVSPENVVPKPGGLSFEEAASLPLTLVTAWHMLVTRAQVRQGETVLVNAAGSGVGVFAIQVAKLRDARVIASAGSDAKLERARELGADETINYATSDLAQEARRLSGGRGVDVVVEHVGGEIFAGSVGALARNGRLVTCGATAGNDGAFHISRFFLAQQSILGSFLGTKGELLTALPFVKSGRIKPVVDNVYPLSEIRQAVQRLLDRAQFGKVVVTP